MLNLKAGNIFARKYTLKKRLGHGGFSEVWLVHHERADIDQALKVYTGLDTNGQDTFRMEFAQMFNLNHPNLLTATDFDIEDGYPFLIMPFYEKGSMLKRIGNVSEGELARLIRDIGQAIAYLHDRRIIHKDIKPDNIMIGDNGEFLLSDFGISTRLRKQFRKISQQRGIMTPEDSGMAPVVYRAPEYFTRSAMGQDPIMASDIWAFGASLFEMAMGEPPFGHFGGSALHAEGAEYPNLSKQYSREFNSLIKKCLAKEPWDRPSARSLTDYAVFYLENGYWNVSSPSLEPAYGGSLIPDMPPPPRPVAEARNIPDRQPEVQHTKPSQPNQPFWMKHGTAIFVTLLIFVLGIFGVAAYQIMGGKDPTSTNPTAEKEVRQAPRQSTQATDSSTDEGLTPLPSTNDLEEDKGDEHKVTPSENKRSSTPKESQPQPDRAYTRNTDGSYTFSKPYVQKQPSDRGNSDCNIWIKEVRLKQNETRVIMHIAGMKCSGSIVYGPSDSDRAYYLKANSKQYNLSRVAKVPVGEQFDVSLEGRSIYLYFPGLPKGTGTFDLIEGKKQFEIQRRAWNFYEIHVKEW